MSIHKGHKTVHWICDRDPNISHLLDQGVIKPEENKMHKLVDTICEFSICLLWDSWRQGITLKSWETFFPFRPLSHYLQRNPHSDEIVIVISALTDKQMNGYLEEMAKIYISSIILYKPKRISKIFKMVIDRKHITLILEKSMNRHKNREWRYKIQIHS